MKVTGPNHDVIILLSSLHIWVVDLGSLFVRCLTGLIHEGHQLYAGYMIYHIHVYMYVYIYIYIDTPLYNIYIYIFIYTHVYIPTYYNYSIYLHMMFIYR